MDNFGSDTVSGMAKRVVELTAQTAVIVSDGNNRSTGRT
jgi:hypothetical protein